MSTATKAPPRQRTFSPSEFAGELSGAGIPRSERWVQDHCKAGNIRTLPIPGRYVIPEAELRRLVAAS